MVMWIIKIACLSGNIIIAAVAYCTSVGSRVCVCVIAACMFVVCVFSTQLAPLSSRSTRYPLQTRDRSRARRTRRDDAAWPVHSGPTPQSPDSKAY